MKPAYATETIRVATSPKSTVGILVAMPDDWNGRFVGVGSGGEGGVLDIRSLEPYLSQGYAAAMTDLGTAPNAIRTGFANPEVWRDFGHRATHAMTIAAKDCIARHYGRPPRFSYFSGASTGGQQAFSEAQRHPEDYDAILAGVPAHCRARLHAYFLWNWQHLRTPDGGRLFSHDQERSCHRACLEAFANMESFPGARMRFVSTPRWTPDAIERAIGIAARADPSLGAPHIDALRALYSGPRHRATGEKIFDGIPPAGDFALAARNLYLFNWIFGEETDYSRIDFGKSIDLYLARLSPDLDAEDANLSAFEAAGGKMIVYAGTQDSIVPCGATLDYFGRLARLRGGAAAARRFFRLFILPGREHFGGPGIQELRRPLAALRRWREKGVEPNMEGVSCTEHRIVPLEPV